MSIAFNIACGVIFSISQLNGDKCKANANCKLYTRRGAQKNNALAHTSQLPCASLRLTEQCKKKKRKPNLQATFNT